MFKKILCILLSAVLLLSFCSCSNATKPSDDETADTSSAQWKIDNSVLQYPATNSVFRYNVYTHYVTISQCLSPEPNITIPDTIDQLPVIGIEAKAFKECETLKSLTMGQNVANIGQSAFEGCKNFETVVMPSSLMSIGESAFKDCEKLKSVIIPKGVFTIPSSCFYGCTSLKSVTIEGSDSTTKSETTTTASSFSSGTQNTGRSIGASAFAYCSQLAYAWIPSDIVKIEQSAFTNATDSLTVYGYATSQAAIFSANNLIDFVVLDKSQFTSMINSSFNHYPGLNESIQTSDLKVTLNNVTKTTTVGGLKSAENNIFLIAEFSVENLSDEPIYFNSLFVTGTADNIEKYPVYFASGTYTQPILAGTVTKMSPLKGYVAFEVSKDYNYVLIDFNDVADFNAVDSVMAVYKTQE